MNFFVFMVTSNINTKKCLGLQKDPQETQENRKTKQNSFADLEATFRAP